jgi:hypothetical protein
MAKHSDERYYSKHIALLTALFLPLGAIALVSDAALAQQQRHVDSLCVSRWQLV